MIKKRSFLIIAIAFFIMGCAGIKVQHDDINIPAGKIEGNYFTGIRYPFHVTAPPDWKMTMEFPDFLKELGYDKPDPGDNEVTELYLFNPETKSNIQIDFTPAGHSAQFSQKYIELLTTAAMGSLQEEMEKDYGKGIKFEVSPTEPYILKGVQFAAQKYATYSLEGVKREQGWIYGFSEPYQIFILYMILPNEGANDREDMKTILDSFEVIPPK